MKVLGLSAYEAVLLLLGAVIGVVVFILAMLLWDRIDEKRRERRNRRWPV